MADELESSKKKDRYVPIDVNVAFKRFGTKLQAKWGMEGLCAWMLLLAAAKREPAQGVFTYTSEPEAWTKLGATATGFGFNEFITFCGRNKQTRRTVSGRVNYIEITGWKQWNDSFKRQADAQRKSSKRAHSTRTQNGHVTDIFATEVDNEVEGENEVTTSTVDQQKSDRAAPIESGLEPLREIGRLYDAMDKHGCNKQTHRRIFSYSRELKATDISSVLAELLKARAEGRVHKTEAAYVVGALEKRARKASTTMEAA